LTYLYPIPVSSESVIEDYRGIMANILPLNKPEIVNSILSYNIHPDWICYLSLLKALSVHSETSRTLYLRHLSRSKWSFPRDQVVEEMMIIGQSPGVNTLLYIPEERRWQMSSSGNKFVVKLRLTEDSIEPCWESRECRYYSEIHHKYSHIAHLATATSVIEDMFGCRVGWNRNGNLEITGSKNRTSDEAAQRVLLHFLKQVGAGNKFHYKVGKVKFLSACREFDIRMRMISSPISLRIYGPEDGIVPDFKFKTETIKKNKMGEEQLKEKIDIIREEEREKLAAEAELVKKDKERLERETRAYFRSQYYEVLREMMIKKEFQYKAQIERARANKNHVLFQPRREHMYREVVDQLHQATREKSGRKRMMWDKMLSKEITKEEMKSDPVMKELEEKCNYLNRLVEAIESGGKDYDEMRKELMPYGDEKGIDHHVQRMISKSREDSDDERLIAVPNEEIEEMKAELKSLLSTRPTDSEGMRNKQSRIRELKEELKVANPLKIERRHKGRHLPKPLPLKDSSEQIRKIAEEKIQRITRVAEEKVVVEKRPTPRKENLKMLGDWVSRMLESRDQKEIFRERLMHDITVAPKSVKRPDFTEKQKKSFRYQFEKGMIKEIPTIKRYSWETTVPTVEEQRPQDLLLNLSVSVKALLAECLTHLRKRSGRQPGKSPVLISNNEAVGVAFLLINKPKMLRYVIPSNLSKVFYKHYRKKFFNSPKNWDGISYS